MSGPQGDRWTAEIRAQHDITHKETGFMKQVTYTNAAAGNAAGVARLRPGHGICAQWQAGGTRAGTFVTGMSVDLTESKYHVRWPGEPSS
jgi:hypothetical protein